MLDSNERSRSALVATTLKMATVVTVLCVAAAGLLSRTGFDRDPTRVASVGRGVIPEPTTTGSIGRSANSVKLDPCSTRDERR